MILTLLEFVQGRQVAANAPIYLMTTPTRMRKSDLGFAARIETGEALPHTLAKAQRDHLRKIRGI
jgi:hypothetical protein